MATVFQSHPAEQRWKNAEYTVTGRRVDAHGNVQEERNYGPEAPRQVAAHLTFVGGTWSFYSPSGGKLFDCGNGVTHYTAPDGVVTRELNGVVVPDDEFEPATPEMAQWILNNSNQLRHIFGRPDAGNVARAAFAQYQTQQGNAAASAPTNRAERRHQARAQARADRRNA